MRAGCRWRSAVADCAHDREDLFDCRWVEPAPRWLARGAVVEDRPWKDVERLRGDRRLAGVGRESPGWLVLLNPAARPRDPFIHLGEVYARLPSAQPGAFGPRPPPAHLRQALQQLTNLVVGHADPVPGIRPDVSLAQSAPGDPK
jgi:hypothetical protein